MDTLAPDALLLGGSLTHEVEIPASVLRPGASDQEAVGGAVILRPLRLLELTRVQRAARDEPLLSSALMVQQSLVSPALSLAQVQQLHAGLLRFLLGEVHRISGLDMSSDDLERQVQQPMARACFALAREFGWTPQQCAELTLGQVLLYLEMIGQRREEQG